MARPVSNVTQVVGEITLHRDLDDPRLMHYRPVPHWAALEVSSPGRSLTALAGQITFDLNESEYARLKSALPDTRFAPLVPKDVRGTVRATVEVNPPHTLTIRVLNALPFPQIIISGSLRKQESNHDEILAAIETHWRSRTFLTGDFEIVVDMREVAAAYDVGVKPAVVVRDIVSDTKGKGWGTASEMTSAVAATVDRRFDEFVKPMFKGAGADKREAVVAILEADISKNFIFRDGQVFVFDEGPSVERLKVRDALELGNPPVTRLTKSQGAEVHFKMLGS